VVLTAHMVIFHGAMPVNMCWSAPRRVMRKRGAADAQPPTSSRSIAGRPRPLQAGELQPNLTLNGLNKMSRCHVLRLQSHAIGPQIAFVVGHAGPAKGEGEPCISA
jgi:hypothetical protein